MSSTLVQQSLKTANDAVVLRRVQAVSGLLFGAFVLVHLINLLLAPFGAAFFDQAQNLTRSVYQFAPLEVVLLASGLLHGGIGVWRVIRERGRELSLRARWHRYAGVFLAVVIVGHIFAVRGSSFFYDVYPQFAGLAFSMDYLPYYFYPYYFLLGLSGAYHGLNGAGIALRRLTSLRVSTSNPALKVYVVVMSVGLLATLTSLGGVWFEVGAVQESDFAQLAAKLGLIELE